MDILDIIVNQGLGVASFFILAYAVWRGLQFMDRLVNNHLTHIEKSLTDMGTTLKEMSESMRDYGKR